MPNITSSGTYTKSSTGLSALARNYGSDVRLLKFAGTTIGTSITIKSVDDTGTNQDITNGSVTALPTDLTITDPAELQIVVVGSPNFNLTIETLDVR